MDSVLQMRASELCSSAKSQKTSHRLRGAIIQILPTEMKASGTCDYSQLFKKPPPNFAQLARYQPKRDVPKGSSPPTSVLSQAQNGDKMIMTQLAATQLSHRGIMSENEIVLKILRRPRLEQKGLLC